MKIARKDIVRKKILLIEVLRFDPPMEAKCLQFHSN